jgi:transposase, IS6 family
MRDAEAATRFFYQALHVAARWAPQACPSEEQGAQPTGAAVPTTTTAVPRVINVEKQHASPKAIANLKASAILPEHVEWRQVKSLNNLMEQDHRFIKRLTKPGMGFFSFETAWRT